MLLTPAFIKTFLTPTDGFVESAQAVRLDRAAAKINLYIPV